MKNEVLIKGSVALIQLASRCYGNLYSLVDRDEVPRILDFEATWVASYSKDTKSFYCQAQLKDKSLFGTTCLGLHRFIMNAPLGLEVDHINHDTLDNRKVNLRLATRSQNMQNLKGAFSTSKTGIRGVYWEPERQKFRAELTLGRKKIRIGRFDSLVDAAQAISEARHELMPFTRF